MSTDGGTAVGRLLACQSESCTISRSIRVARLDDGPSPDGHTAPAHRETTHAVPTVSVDTFCDDPLYPRSTRTVEQMLTRGKAVASVDVEILRHASVNAG